jgi:protein PhnA
MNIEEVLLERSNSVCELCAASTPLVIYYVQPSGEAADQSLFICKICSDQLEEGKALDSDHWRCLNDSMWSPVPAVQVMAYRLLKKLSVKEEWPQAKLDMLYLEPDAQVWADSDSDGEDIDAVITKDSNGALLNAGDTV